MGEDGSLVIETARTCLGPLVMEGETRAAALVRKEDGEIWGGGNNKAGSDTGECWRDCS